AREHLKRFRLAVRVEDAEAVFWRLRQLDVYRDQVSSFPSERIDDQNRDAVGSGSIHPAGDLVQSVRGQVPRLQPDEIIIALRIFIDIRDPGSGSKIMKLIEEHFFPCFSEFNAGVGKAL